MDFSSLSPRKKVFLVLGAVVLVLVIFGLTKLNSSVEKKPTTKSAKELNVWVVRDETAGYSDIIADFKKQNSAYAATEIKVTKFGSYSDYERTLINVMADGNGPDIFVVNNNGWALLESKIVPIPGTVVLPEDFEKRFARVFDDLVVTNKEKNEAGEEVSVRYLKWIPFWYETLGVFYNWKLIKSVPLTWSDIDREIQSGSGAEFAMVGLWLDGKKIIGAPDILSLFFLQNNIVSYKNLWDIAAVNGYTTYQNYGSDPLNYVSILRDEMQAVGLNIVDEFVRGKVAMIFWYPSLLSEIEYSIKRAGPELAINNKFLRTEVIPQVFDAKWKMVNLANYSYFALSKNSKNPEAAQALLKYFSTKWAEKLYLKNFPVYLPSQSEFDADRLAWSVSTEFDKVRYQSFLRDGVENKTFDKWLKSVFDEYFNAPVVTASGATTYQEILADGTKYIDCEINHYINNTDYENECIKK